MAEQVVYVPVPQEQKQESMPGYGPRLDSRADLMDKIRPDLVVDDIYHMLQGEIKQKGSWTKIDQDKALTPEGARAICTLLFASSSQNTSLATLDDQDIRRIVIGNVADAMKLCLSNMKAYGIKSKDQLYFVKNIVKNNTFFVAKQAQDGALRNGLLRTQLELRQFQQQQTSQGGKIDVFGAFNKLRK